MNLSENKLQHLFGIEDSVLDDTRINSIGHELDRRHLYFIGDHRSAYTNHYAKGRYGCQHVLNVENVFIVHGQ